jgi:SAM-dependent methyltransferase
LVWKSPSSKNKLSASERASLERLAKVRRRRQPFEGLSRRLVGETLAQYLPHEGTVVEIGMGDGQLWERLPRDVLPRVVHTEPQAAASRAFRKAHPDVRVLQAPAEQLPFETGSVAAVVGLCVMDVLPDGAAVARELGRVLGPGGRFIHWLDMSTVLAPVVATLSGTEVVPFPNVFSDPVTDGWPEDLFLVSRQEVELVVAILIRHGHPLARPMAQYLATFSESPLPVGRAAAELIQLQDSAELRHALKAAFAFAHYQAEPAIREQLLRFQGRPVSSARHFEQRLSSWFGEDTGFRVEQSTLARAWDTNPRGDAELTYMSCCVGEQRGLPTLPDTLLCPEASAGDLEILRELALHVFVASRI